MCSNYLEGLDKDDEVQMFIRSAPSFRMPQNKTHPMILIGPGKFPFLNQFGLMRLKTKFGLSQAQAQLHLEVFGKNLMKSNRKTHHTKYRRFGYFSVVEQNLSIFIAMRRMR